MPCREHLAQLREQQPTLDQLGAAVLVVTFEPEAPARRFARREALPFPLLRDPSGRAYEAFGLRQGTSREVWSWNALKSYAHGALHGVLPQRPNGDLNQLGGDFVLDGSGRLVFAHRSSDPADRPAVDDILAAVRRAADDSREVNDGP